MSLETFTAQLKRHEGWRDKPYFDSLGIGTFGYGFTYLTKEEGEFILMNRILSCSEDLGANLPWTEDLDDARRHVLLNMAFNMGIGGLLGFVNTLRAVQEGRYDDAAAGMLASKWATQVGSRATELAEQMRTGVEK